VVGPAREPMAGADDGTEWTGVYRRSARRYASELAATTARSPPSRTSSEC